MTKEEAFVYWGTANGWSKEKGEQFKIAEAIHKKDMEENPDDHRFAPGDRQKESRGYTTSRCKCGFGWYVDSSG
jgi:hypothetical protein